MGRWRRCSGRARSWWRIVPENYVAANRPRRILVTGSRTFTDRDLIEHVLAEKFKEGDIVIVHGGARGADRMADEWAVINSVKRDVYPVVSSDWQRFGKRAGILRNEVMLDSGPDLVIAFWDGKSKGTAHTISEARRRGIPFELHFGKPEGASFAAA